MHLVPVLPLAAADSAQTLRVSAEDQQVWLARDDSSRQRLTEGPSYKSSPTWSPDQGQIAYFRYCPKDDCAPEIVIGELRGAVRSSFGVVSPRDNSVCASVTRIDWLEASRLGVDCHKNPSYGEYMEVDLASRRVLRSWLGHGFAWSPDRRRLAYAGWNPHFSPPFAHPDSLRIDRSPVYPPEAVRQIPAAIGLWDLPVNYQAPEQGGLYRGIHEFSSRPVWSPDGKWVALLDRVYDWQWVDGNQQDGERNIRYEAVVASADGSWSACEMARPAGPATLSWIDPGSLRLETNAVRCHLALQGGKLSLTGCETLPSATIDQ